MGAQLDATKYPQLAKLFAELGMPLGGYTQSWKLGLIMLVAGAATLLFGIVHPGILWVGVVAALAGVSSLWFSLRYPNYRVCPGGILVWRWRTIESCPWDKIRTLAFFRKTQTMYGWTVAGSGELSGTVEREDGRKFLLQLLTRPLIEFIELETYRVLLPRAREQLAAGREVVFRDVALRTDGLSYKGTVIRWEEIERIETSNNVTVRKRDGSRAYLWNVPNLSLFLLLARERLSGGTRPEAEARAIS